MSGRDDCSERPRSRRQQGVQRYFTGDGQGGRLQKVPYGQKSAHSEAVRHSITGKSCTRQKQLQGERRGRAWYIWAGLGTFKQDCPRQKKQQGKSHRHAWYIRAGLGLRRRHSPIVQRLKEWPQIQSSEIKNTLLQCFEVSINAKKNSWSAKNQHVKQRQDQTLQLHGPRLSLPSPGSKFKEDQDLCAWSKTVENTIRETERERDQGRDPYCIC